MTSKATKRKHVIKEVLDEFVLPENDQQIVKVVSSCGNNLHQVNNKISGTSVIHIGNPTSVYNHIL